ncbi:MAG TPA: response regulator [Candidatus Methylomirabilis sp.]|nr:response regulator [Candidatus Methylomirabilis sp.]HSB79397.1 response regulator [Candidatus Methylomirabilis sp.]
MEETRDAFGVLVVEDGDKTRCLVADVLREASCRVWTASDGVEAVEILEAERVDLLLTDYDMPRMNGLELLRWSQAHVPHVPRVLMTGLECEAVAAEAWKCGAQRILLKPFSVDHLLLILGELRLAAAA